MYILLTLFFISLISIIFMIGRRLVLLRAGHTMIAEGIVFEIPHLKKIKHITVTNFKKYGHKSVVETLRFYIRGTNLLKNKYQEIKIKINTFGQATHKNGEKKEISKFLKVIGDYKHKIRKIKEKIHEEENSL